MDNIRDDNIEHAGEHPSVVDTKALTKTVECTFGIEIESQESGIDDVEALIENKSQRFWSKRTYTCLITSMADSVIALIDTFDLIATGNNKTWSCYILYSIYIVISLLALTLSVRGLLASKF